MSETLRVECYAGYRGEETPRRFFIGDRAVGIVDIVDRWLAPEHRYFKCACDDGDIYVIRHDEAQDAWELTLFQRGEVPRSRVR